MCAHVYSTSVVAWGSCAACWTAWTGWRRPVAPPWTPDSGSAASTMRHNAVLTKSDFINPQIRVSSHSNTKVPSPPWSLSPGASRGLDGGASSPRPSGPYGVCSCCWKAPPSAQMSACCPEFALGHKDGGHQGSAAPWWQAATMLLSSSPSPSTQNIPV